MARSCRETERRCGGRSGVPPVQVVCAGWPDIELLPGLDGCYGVPRRGLPDRAAHGERGSGRRVPPAVEQYMQRHCSQVLVKYGLSAAVGSKSPARGARIAFEVLVRRKAQFKKRERAVSCC